MRRALGARSDGVWRYWREQMKLESDLELAQALERGVRHGEISTEVELVTLEISRRARRRAKGLPV